MINERERHDQIVIQLQVLIRNVITSRQKMVATTPHIKDFVGHFDQPAAKLAARFVGFGAFDQGDLIPEPFGLSVTIGKSKIF